MTPEDRDNDKLLYLAAELVVAARSYGLHNNLFASRDPDTGKKLKGTISSFEELEKTILRIRARKNKCKSK